MVIFPKTLEAARAAENAQWKIGDALVAETEDGSERRSLSAVAAELIQHGIDLSVTQLTKLRAVADAFPKNRRLDLPWSVHMEAGNPDTLDVIVKVARKDGTKVTKWTVREIARQVEQEAKVEREKAVTAAKKEEERARERERKAEERERKAADKRERNEARKARVKAAKEAAAARKKAKKAKQAPKKKDRPAPQEDDLPSMVIKQRFQADMSDARRLVAKMKREIAPNMGDLSPAFINSAVEDLLSLANSARELADVLRRGRTEKRGHLAAVVNE